jgi:hypothetical protein
VFSAARKGLNAGRARHSVRAVFGFMNGVQRTAPPTAVCFRLRFAAFLLGSNFYLMRLDLPGVAKYRC